jgi:hypothetical protein
MLLFTGEITADHSNKMPLPRFTWFLSDHPALVRQNGNQEKEMNGRVISCSEKNHATHKPIRDSED